MLIELGMHFQFGLVGLASSESVEDTIKTSGETLGLCNSCGVPPPYFLTGMLTVVFILLLGYIECLSLNFSFVF